MKILKQEKKDNKFTFELEVPFILLKQAREREIAEAAKTLKVPGFRPGKAPANIADGYLDKEVLKARALRALVSEIYPHLMAEAKIDPIDYPTVSAVKEDEAGGVVNLGISVEVYPEVHLGKYKGLKAEKKDTKVSEKELEDALSALRDQYADFKDVADRAVAEGDIAELNVKAFSEGKEVFSLNRSNLGIIIGANQWLPGFDPQIMGAKSGETREFCLNLPDDFQNKALAGKPVDLKVEVKRIVEKTLPGLTDEFTKNNFGIESTQKLKEQILADLERKKIEDAEADLKNKLIEQISAEATVEVPVVLINREIEIMLDELSNSLANSKLTLEDYLKATKKDQAGLREELKPAAEKRVKSKLVLRAIGEVEKIEITDTHINEEITKLAANLNRPSQDLSQDMGESGRAYIKEYLFRRKALDLVLEKAKS